MLLLCPYFLVDLIVLLNIFYFTGKMCKYPYISFPYVHFNEE